MSWIKNLFHTHDMHWTSREVIEKTTVTSNGGVCVDVEPATVYLYKGQCLSCGEYLKEKITILDIFDVEQPFDKKD